ncbi:MAG: hypothetical protein LBN30_09710 [Oscillospiraceae bacterium]|jgi:hypothetical protein|nr:hypothetical protein [Oscillospiraceae bacterium]
MHIKAYFDTGRIVVTSHAADTLTDADITAGLARHVNCDWGELESEDQAMNNAAVKSGEDRIFSAYKSESGAAFWVITEWDRSYTTVLLPEDY